MCGPATVYVKSGTSHGEYLILQGKGVNSPKKPPGNHVVTWKVKIPNGNDLSDKQRQLIEEFGKMNKE